MNIAEIMTVGSKGRRSSVAALAGCLLALGAMGAAWACTVSPSLSVEPGFSTPGSLVTIQGAFIPLGAKAGQSSEAGPVEIRWNSSDGPQIGTAQPSATPSPNGTNFSVSVTIPDQAIPGVFYLVAIQRDSLGNVVAKAAETFEVRSAGPSESRASQRAVSGDLWSALARDTALMGGAGSDLPAAASSGYLALGVSLAGISSLGMALGAGILAVRRRRVQQSR